MATDLTVNELKNILRCKNVSTTGNKSKLLLRLQQNNPEGLWLEEWKRKERDERKGKEDDLEQSTFSDEGNQDLILQLSTMQQMIMSLILQLQQSVVLSNPNTQYEGVQDDSSTSKMTISLVQSSMVSTEYNTAQSSSALPLTTHQGTGADVLTQVSTQKVTSL